MKDTIKRKIGKTAVAAIVALIVGISINAFGQSNSDLKIEPDEIYFYKGKKAAKPFNFMFRFQSEGAVLYSYEYQGAATIRGSWTIEKNVLTIVLPVNDSPVTVKFKKKGDDLKIIETQFLNRLISVGKVFRKYADSPAGPDLTAKDFAGRIINFAKNIRTVRDVAPENIEREMSVKVVYNEEDRSRYGFWGKIANTSWRYGLIAYPYPSAGNKTTDTVRFSFDNPNENVEFGAACVELETFQTELKSAGFSSFNAVGSHNVTRGLVFSRDNLYVHVYVQGSGFSYEEIKNNCVQMVIVGAENAGKQ